MYKTCSNNPCFFFACTMTPKQSSQNWSLQHGSAKFFRRNCGLAQFTFPLFCRCAAVVCLRLCQQLQTDTRPNTKWDSQRTPFTKLAINWMGEHEDQLGTLQYGFGLKVQIPTVKLSNASKNIKAEINSPPYFGSTTGVQRWAKIKSRAD